MKSFFPSFSSFPRMENLTLQTIFSRARLHRSFQFTMEKKRTKNPIQVFRRTETRWRKNLLRNEKMNKKIQSRKRQKNKKKTKKKREKIKQIKLKKVKNRRARTRTLLAQEIYFLCLFYFFFALFFSSQPFSLFFFGVYCFFCLFASRLSFSLTRVLYFHLLVLKFLEDFE